MPVPFDFRFHDAVVGHYSAGGENPKEIFKRARERAEQARQQNPTKDFLERWAPKPRELTPRDVEIYDKAQELQERQSAAKEIARQDRIVEKIEGLMRRDFDAYCTSCWPEEYARLTGADRDAAERK